jgi:hypothetical protein
MNKWIKLRNLSAGQNADNKRRMEMLKKITTVIIAVLFSNAVAYAQAPRPSSNPLVGTVMRAQVDTYNAIILNVYANGTEQQVSFNDLTNAHTKSAYALILTAFTTSKPVTVYWTDDGVSFYATGTTICMSQQ